MQLHHKKLDLLLFLKIHVPAGSNTETLVRKVIENLGYNVEVVPE